jgi:hypothetical protein
MKRIFYYLLLGIFFTACSSETVTCDDAFNTTKFKLNKDYCLNNDETLVIKLLEDSRCQTGVICAWEGQVKLQFDIATSAGLKTQELTIKNDNSVQTFDNIESYKFTIRNVNPYPKYGETYTEEDYEIEMQTEKK